MNRVYNFSAGPSMLPEAVLKRAAEEMLSFGSSGQSVMEMSHRSSEYQAIFDETKQLLIDTLNIPEDYEVLFLQGGASTQFAAVPLNLANGSGKADYVVTGQFAKKSHAEADKLIDCIKVADSSDENFSYIPKLDRSDFSKDADYVHICQNNTIYGTCYHTLPDTGDVPLVADLSSCILSEPIDVSKYGVIYAGAQKNMAPAGVTIVIIRKDLVADNKDKMPTMLSYKTHVDANSMFNTPPTYPIYICGLVLKWIRDDIDGIDKMAEMNRAKAKMLYDYLDSSDMFGGVARECDRSIMNITFKTVDSELDAKFIGEAKKAGFINLKGHRTAGGMRASIYNAMPTVGIEKLVKFMAEFETNNK